MPTKTKNQKKLRILAAGDLHGSKDIAKRLSEKAKKQKVDLVILAGDIYGFVEGDPKILEPFRKAKQKVVFVPGNWDSSIEIDLLRGMSKAKNIDGYYVNYNGVDIVGVGNPDFELSVDEKKTFNKIQKNFERIKTKSNRKILVSHMHAKDTKSEFSGFEGSKALKRAIEKFQPDVFISAHIHEAEGIEEKIGKTRVINVGRRGRVLEV